VTNDATATPNCQGGRLRLTCCSVYCAGGASSSSTVNSDAAAAAANSWLLGDTARRHLVVKDVLSGSSLLSVNSLDVSHNCLLCGTDAEQITLIRNLAIVWSHEPAILYILPYLSSPHSISIEWLHVYEIYTDILSKGQPSPVCLFRHCWQN